MLIIAGTCGSNAFGNNLLKNALTQCTSFKNANKILSEGKKLQKNTLMGPAPLSGHNGHKFANNSPGKIIYIWKQIAEKMVNFEGLCTSKTFGNKLPKIAKNIV